MNPRVKKVIPNRDFTLTLYFDNGEIKKFDMTPYLDKGVFKELKDWNLFRTVKPCAGSIQWIHEQDLCPDTLYLEGEEING